MLQDQLATDTNTNVRFLLLLKTACWSQVIAVINLNQTLWQVIMNICKQTASGFTLVSKSFFFIGLFSIPIGYKDILT